MKKAAIAEINEESRWKNLYRVGGVAALTVVGIMVVQILIFVIWPPPETVEGFIDLMQDHPLLGLLSMDLLYILNNTILVLIYLALFLALRRSSETAVMIAMLLGTLGVAAYYASNTGFEMLALSGQYDLATSEAERTALLGAGQALLAIYKGTAFDTYYVLNAAALLIFAVVMLRSKVFSTATGGVGLAAGILMLVPSTAGTLGLIFSLASLVPWAIFSVMVARRLFQMGRRNG
ncbi:MAG: hypothetical protein JW987_12570 [Anaerolineaceae bacterium]|nr:hypothetical protein [Anaerolineaceae bacterium]